MKRKKEKKERKNNKNLLQEVLEKSKPSEEDLKEISKNAKSFCNHINANLKKFRIKAEIFVGGSFAKGTVIKKDKYDVDVFIRYDKKYKNEELSSLTEKLIENFRNTLIIHGSRDYFRINYSDNFFIELIPVRKITKPKDYENITDLSYLHVKYINKKIRDRKILDEIKIAKAFCYAHGCYGAESYIHGFSGYSLELLVYHYKSFNNFIKALSKIGKNKLIIDIEKHFKNKKDVLMDLNSSKLNSPIILIDPTYKHRNVLAALSQETFEKFQKACKAYLKSPSIKHFEVKKIDFESIEQDALKKGREFLQIQASTDKPEGDVAGSKLLKFYNYLEKEISRFFIIKNKGFVYDGESSARYFFVTERKKEIIHSGPFTDDEKHCENFRKEHKDVYEKNNRLYARERIQFNLKQFLDIWKANNEKIIKEMYIDDLALI
jgi:tRNA CCA-adding enzyme